MQRGLNSPTEVGQHLVELIHFLMTIRRHPMGALYPRCVKSEDQATLENALAVPSD